MLYIVAKRYIPQKSVWKCEQEIPLGRRFYNFHPLSSTLAPETPKLKIWNFTLFTWWRDNLFMLLRTLESIVIEVMIN